MGAEGAGQDAELKQNFFYGTIGGFMDTAGQTVSTPTQVPSVGRIVHYYAYGSPGGEFPAGVPRAAIITEVDEPGNPASAVGLCVLSPTGQLFSRHVPIGMAPGHWSWPPYVPPAR